MTAEEETKMTNLSELRDLLGCEGAVYVAAGYVLVDDGATRAIYSSKEADVLAEKWQRNLDRAEADEDGYDRGQAYSLACSATSALQSDQVPAEVAAALAEEAGLDLDSLTYGW